MPPADDPDGSIERQRRAQRILAELFDLAPTERLPRLEELCAGDDELRDEVASLLRASDDAAGFLDTPAIESARESLTEEVSLAGRRLGNFELLEEIGRGGMGIVHRARQRSPERIVAVKVTPGAFSPSAKRRFEAESRALARMQHPAIATVLEAGIDGATGIAWIAMEYVREGRPISTFVRDRALAATESVDIFLQACEAVHHGHLKGVIHRDLKPSNILVDADGWVKVIDFGIARLLGPDDSRATMTAAGAPIGTLAYMSPEQCAGDSADVRSDVYSLGVVLHELLAGAPPFAVSDRSLEAALRTIRSEPPPPLRRTVPSISADLETIVLAALEKSPERRYQSVAALVDDLHRWREHRPIEARPAGWMHHVALFVQRHRAVALAIAIVILAMAAATAVSVSFALDAHHELAEREKAESIAEAERDAAIHHSYVATVALAGAALEAGEISRLRRHLDDAAPKHRGWEWSYLDRQSRPEAAVMRLHESRVTCIAAQPRGDLIASGDINGVVRLWRRDGTPLEEPLRLDRSVFGLAWTPDGDQLIVAPMLRPIRVHRVVASEGRVTLEPTDTEFPIISGGVACLTLSADGSLLAYGGERGGRVWRRDAGSLLCTVEAFGAVRAIAFSPDGDRFAISRDQLVEIRRSADGEILHTLPSRTATNSLAWSPDGAIVAGGNVEGSVQLWSAEDGAPLREARFHHRAILAVAISPDGSSLFSGGDDSRVVQWSLPDLVPVRLLAGHGDAIQDIVIANDGRLAITSSSDRTVRTWSLDSPEPDARSLGERWRPAIHALAYSPDGRRLVAGNERGLVTLLDGTTWESIRVRDTPGTGCSAAAFSPDGVHLALGHGPNTILLLDAAMETITLTLTLGAEVGTDKSTSRRVGSLAFSPDGSLLAAGSADFGVRVWRITGGNRGELVASLTAGGAGHGADVTAVAFAPDGTAVYSASVDRSVAKLDLATNQRVWSRVAHVDAVTALAVHPDGRELVTGGKDQRIVILNAGDGSVVETLAGHGQAPTGILFLDGGSRMAVASSFADLKMWDWSMRRELLTLRAPELTSFRALALRPDGRELTVSGEGAITRWSIDRIRPLAPARGR